MWRWLAVAGLVLGLVAAGFAGGRGFERPRAFKAGQVAQDRVWLAAIAKAKAEHVARARATEAANERIRQQEARRYEADIVELRAGYHAVRQRMRDKAGGRGASGAADLPRLAPRAGSVDAACRADHDAIAAALVNASEEGDGYRAMVMGWQEWAVAVGVAAPPE